MAALERTHHVVEMAPPLAGHLEVVYKLVLAVLAAALVVSVITDLRERLIYNVVTGPAFVLELALIGLATGTTGLKQAAIGMLICAGPIALSSVRGWMGLGDAKLMAVVGIVAGATGNWLFAITVLCYVAVAGGILAAIPWIAAAARKREKPKYVPYGVAIAVGAAAAWLLN